MAEGGGEGQGAAHHHPDGGLRLWSRRRSRRPVLRSGPAPPARQRRSGGRGCSGAAAGWPASAGPRRSVKATAEAKAACQGLTMSVSSMLSSADRWAARASWAVSSSATLRGCFGAEALALVDGGEFRQLFLRLFGQLPAFLFDQRLLAVALAAHGDVLAQGHGDGATHQRRRPRRRGWGRTRRWHLPRPPRSPRRRRCRRWRPARRRAASSAAGRCRCRAAHSPVVRVRGSGVSCALLRRFVRPCLSANHQSFPGPALAPGRKVRHARIGGRGSVPDGNVLERERALIRRPTAGAVPAAAGAQGPGGAGVHWPGVPGAGSVHHDARNGTGVAAPGQRAVPRPEGRRWPIPGAAVG